MAAWLHALLDLVLPQRCAGCGMLGESLCPACIARITPPPANVCPICGSVATAKGRVCRACRQYFPHLAGLVAAGLFTDPLRRAVHQFKYRGRTTLAPALGSVLAQAVQRSGWQGELVVPVPLHARRARERGYNQALLLAQEVARRVGVPVAPDGLLRVADTPPQVGLAREQRLRNVANAFNAISGAFAGSSVLLIDDVATTGATLAACASTVAEQGGAREAWGAVVAREV